MRIAGPSRDALARTPGGRVARVRSSRATLATLGALLLALFVAACRTDAPRPDATLVGTTMGTSWKVTVARDGGFATEELTRLRGLVQGELDAVEASMSTWRDDTEIARFNRAEPGAGFEVSTMFWAVLDAAREAHRTTGGAFDPTVHPLVRAYGFGGGDGDERVPTDAERAALVRRVGFEKVRLDARPVLDKSEAGVELDLSAVAKGYAVDRVHAALAEAGVERAMVEVGGELRVRGERPGGGPWRLGIEDPRVAEARVPFAVVQLSDGALATSGDYRNTVATEDGPVGHLFDPRVGAPVSSRVASSSVLAPTCARADALATAMAVLGGEAAVALALEVGDFEVLVIERGPDGALVEFQTPGFERCRVEAP